MLISLLKAARPRYAAPLKLLLKLKMYLLKQWCGDRAVRETDGGLGSDGKETEIAGEAMLLCPWPTASADDGSGTACFSWIFSLNDLGTPEAK